MTPRQLAFTLLQRIEKNDSFLNLALDHALEGSHLSGSDRALASALIYGVTERRLTLDYQIERLSTRPTDSIDPAVRTALRLGLYQLIYLDRIPAYAAISETVDLLPRRSAGFANAILRAYTRQGALSLPERVGNLLPYLSVAYSVCPALASRLLSDYGEERAEAILRGFERPSATTLSTNLLRTTRDELLTRLSDAVPTEIAPNGIITKGSVRELYGFEDGLFFVQDEASQICVEALGAQPNETVMDICACPGSKSFGTAIRMKNQGNVYSYDLHAKKLPLIESGAKRLGITIISTAERDGRTFIPEMEGRADRVLCDVPCSGFGTLSKKPEIRYKDPADMAGLPDIQLAILENACRYVKVGGVLVYSTCTILPAENEENVIRFLAKHPEFSLTPFSVTSLSVENGMITLFPDTNATDGFFVARMVRKA